MKCDHILLHCEHHVQQKLITKTTHCVVPLIWNVQRGQIDREQKPDSWLPGTGARESSGWLLIDMGLREREEKPKLGVDYSNNDYSISLDIRKDWFVYFDGIYDVRAVSARHSLSCFSLPCSITRYLQSSYSEWAKKLIEKYIRYTVDLCPSQRKVLETFPNWQIKDSCQSWDITQLQGVSFLPEFVWMVPLGAIRAKHTRSQGWSWLVLRH